MTIKVRIVFVPLSEFLRRLLRLRIRIDAEES